MKSNSLHLLFCLLLWSFTSSNAQEWSEKMKDRSNNVNDVINEFNNNWGNRPYQRGYGWKQFKRWQDFWEPRVFPHGIRPPHDHAWKEHKNFQRTYTEIASGSRSSNWTSMGPSSWTTSSYNPGLGRINVVAEDPNDPNTLFVGAPAGGCWKSTDAGRFERQTEGATPG